MIDAHVHIGKSTRLQIDVDGEHLLLALLEQPDGLAPRLLRQAGADPDALNKEVDAELERRPRVSGPGAAPAKSG